MGRENVSGYYVTRFHILINNTPFCQWNIIQLAIESNPQLGKGH